MSKEIAEMDSVSSPWPDNLDTAQVLAIRAGCNVADAYQLICDRKNIKKLVVSGREYTNQEVRSMSFTERLGGERGVIEEPIPVPGEEPAPAPETTFEATAYQRITEGQWMPRRLARYTDPAYDRYIELLRQNNPRFQQFVNVPTDNPLAPPLPMVFTADAGAWMGIDPTRDYYY